MGAVPRIGFRRGLDGLYDHLDNEFPAAGALMRSGEVFWVNSATGVNDVNHGSRSEPYATLDYAIGRCAENNGDVIVVAENHAETITGAAGIALELFVVYSIRDNLTLNILNLIYQFPVISAWQAG